MPSIAMLLRNGAPITGGCGFVLPTPYDDQFDCGSTIDTAGTRFSGARAWTIQNQRTGTATQASSQLTLVCAASANTMDPILTTESLPAGDWSFYTHGAYAGAAFSYLGLGIALRESATGKLLCFGTTRDTSVTGIQVRRLSTFTGWSGSYTPFDAYSPGVFNGWFCVKRRGSLLSFIYSTDGVTWRDLRIDVVQTVDFTTAPDQIGLWVNEASTNGAVTATFDYWFKEDWTTGSPSVKTITIDHTKCGSANTTNYPFLFSGTYSYLKTVANGGSVQSASGADIAFFSDSGLTTMLDFEIESWDGTTGAIQAWVRVPTLTNGSDTVIYLGYGNANIVTPQSNVTGTWESSYHGVWHMGTGLTNYSTSMRRDSTLNANNLTNGANSATPAAGLIGDALSMGTNGFVAPNNASTQMTSAFTVEAWVKPSSFTTYRTIVAKGNGSNRNYALDCEITTGKPRIVFSRGFSTFKVVTGAAAVSTSAWTYLVGTFDGTTLRLYTNGAADGTLVSAGSADNVGVNLEIGSLASSDKFVGLIDEARISNTARSASYVTAQYNNVNAPGTFYTVT